VDKAAGAPAVEVEVVVAEDANAITVRGSVLAAALIALSVSLSCGAPEPQPQPQTQQRTFDTPEAAASTLVDVVKAGKLDELLRLFGPDGKELIEDSDPATGRRHREVFLAAAAERWHLADEGADKRVIVVGNEDWPFPIPLVKDGAAWRFDTAAGKEEVIDRRIGKNELAVIQICRTYVAAQRAYALRGHDGKRPGLYAKAFRSSTGKQDGLYWPFKRGERMSPLGDLVAQAATEGRELGTETRMPFHGYYFKILTAQGPAARGGAKDYVVKGELGGGFGLVAWPAEYDSTGVMTFVVNQDGTLHEADLGPDSDGRETKIASYDPDPKWKPVR
jgi:hypothetical protein